MERLLEGGVWDGPGVAKDGDWEGAGGNHMPEPEIQGEKFNNGFLLQEGIYSSTYIAGHILINIAFHNICNPSFKLCKRNVVEALNCFPML